jgi:mRNA interferase MazF
MIARKTALWRPDRGEIIFIDHNPKAGKEMPDMHPMLVCSTRAFNERTGIVIGFPMTHAAFNADNPFAVAVQGAKGDVGYVLAFQPKSFDWRARNAKKHPLGGGHQKVLAAVLKKLDTICGICEH